MNLPTTRPPTHVASPGLVVGGSDLVLSFFEAALRLSASRVWILVPYVDTAALCDELLRYSWERLVATARVSVVVRSRAAAESVCASLRNPKRIDLRVEPKLHAKVFVATCRGEGIAMVGSQNLTSSALHVNAEVSILARSDHSDELRAVVSSLRSIAEDVARQAIRFDWARR